MTFAAAAAARINASLQARKGIQHVDVPPIQSTDANDGQSGQAKPHSVSKEMYTADGDFIQDIEVNDLRNRYLVTKSSTQKKVNIYVLFSHIFLLLQIYQLLANSRSPGTPICNRDILLTPGMVARQ